MKIDVKQILRDETGAAMVLALVLLLVGALTTAGLLNHMGAGLTAGEVYNRRTAELYAADAGAGNGLWHVENEKLDDLFYDYDEYLYDSPWSYNLSEYVNDKAVNITVENVWIPLGIPVPDAYTARQIIEEGKLIIAGNPTLSNYEIKINYDPCGGVPAVNEIGIWLPAGFEYNSNCSLEGEDYYSEPAVTPYKGGFAVVWSFSPPVSLAEFPSSFTFQYEGPAEQIPSAALSWMDTTTGYTWDADVKVYIIVSTATDPDAGTQTVVESYTSKVELRKLGSALPGDYHAMGNTLMTPTDTSEEGKKFRDRLYKESSATVVEGDIPSNAAIEAAFLYWSGWIEGEGIGAGEEVWSDNCDDFNDWIPGSHWSISYGEFRGQGGGSDADRTLTLNAGVVPLGEYSGQEVNVSWEQTAQAEGRRERLESGDCFKYAFSGDGGASWSNDFVAFCGDNPSSSFSDTIPDEYLTDNFRMRFFLDFDETNEYCNIDNITISVSTGESCVEEAKVNRVMFNDNQITTDQWQVESTADSGAQNSWSYSCHYDVTDIVIAGIDPDTKSGTFTLGHVLEGSGYDLYPSGTTAYPLATPALSSSMQYQWTYAGWSLLIIYTSPETSGHQLFLFDTFRYVGLDTQVSFLISNFLVPDDTTGSHLTYFVGEGDDHYESDYIKINGYKLPQPGDPYEPYEGFNPQNNVFNSYSNSLDDPNLSGVDIDTFDVSDCISPGDSSAEIILDNGNEIYDLVYIILSVRSLVTGGGVMGFMIR